MAIAERIKESLPEILLVDIWNSGFYSLEEEIFWQTPSLFVDFDEIEWHQLNNGVRRGDFVVHLHLIIKYNSGQDEYEAKIEETLDFFDLAEKINSALQGLRGEVFSGFMLASSFTDSEHANIFESVESFVTSVQDTSAMRSAESASISNLKIECTE